MTLDAKHAQGRKSQRPLVAVVLRAWPRLSETFIAQELLELERRGLNMRIYALKKMGPNEAHPLHWQLKSPVIYLGESPWLNPWQFLRAWLLSYRNRGSAEARKILRRQLDSDRRESYQPSSDRRKNFRRGFLLSSRLPRGTSLIYAHFLHNPASVARYAAVMRGFEWSFSAHAKDIWTLPEEEVRQKVQSARWGVTCTDSHRRRLVELGGDWGKIACVYHGLDLRRFPDYAERTLGPAGDDPGQPVVILSAARAVPKKGLDTLLNALSLLPEELNWRWRLVGGGEEAGSLALEAGSLRLTDRIDWLPPLKHHELLDEYRKADLFALPCRIAANGDRDGIPNVLMEAMSQRLPILSTWLPSIRELVSDGGVLVCPNDISSLSEEIEALIRNPWRRLKMGESGRRLIEERFSFAHHIEPLVGKFGLPPLPLATGEANEKPAAGRDGAVSAAAIGAEIRQSAPGNQALAGSPASPP